MACHAEFLRAALEDAGLAQAVLDDPAALATAASDPRRRQIAQIAITVTEAPWRLTRDHLTRARSAGLSDEDVLHVVLLSAFFGHLNRIADAVAVPLDYPVTLQLPTLDHARAPWPTAPSLVTQRAAIDIARRPATANAFTEWRHYIFYSRDTPLTRRYRTLIAWNVATWLGDGGISSPAELTINPLDEALRALAEIVTLAPWRLGDESFARLRAAGFDDAAVFDVCATASSAGMFSRVEVALASLARS